MFMKKLLPIFFAFILIACSSFAQEAKPPVRFAIMGLSHDHAMGFIPRLAGRTDVQLVGIVETKKSGIQLIVNYETTWYPVNQAPNGNFSEATGCPESSGSRAGSSAG